MNDKMTTKAEKKLENNYLKFIDGLEKLSKKYGFAIQACGCFYFDANGFQNIEYVRDLSSGDIDIRTLIFNDGTKLGEREIY